MELSAVLKHLREQIDQINISILALERIQSDRHNSSWSSTEVADNAAPKRRGRPLGSKNKPKSEQELVGTFTREDLYRAAPVRWGERWP